MDVIIKLIGVVGSVMVVVGLFWGLLGVWDFFSGQRNNDGNKTEKGITSMVYGGVMAAISGGITTAIINVLQGIQF